MKLQHALGGLEGLDPIVPELRVFVEPWENPDLRHPHRDDGAEPAAQASGDAERVQDGVDLGGPAQGRGGHEPFDYFKYRYYEKWLGGISGYFVANGYITQKELDDRTAVYPRQPRRAAAQGRRSGDRRAGRGSISGTAIRPCGPCAAEPKFASRRRRS